MPLLSCAVLASVGAGVHVTVDDAVGVMVRTFEWVVPCREEVYDDLYNRVYSKLGPAITPVFHAIADLRGGASNYGELVMASLATLKTIKMD